MCLMLDQFLWGHSSRVCDISCWSHCFNSTESKAEVRYVNEYIVGLLSLSVHIFKEVYISSCDQISCKAHMVGERMYKVFGLTGLEL